MDSGSTMPIRHVVMGGTIASALEYHRVYLNSIKVLVP